jgi:arginine repressor
MTVLNVRGQAPRMDRAILGEQLRLTKVHIALGNEQIARQRELVSLLEQAGKDATAANQLLKHLEKLQKVFVAEAWKLSVQLATNSE